MGLEGYDTGTATTQSILSTYSTIDRKNWVYQPNFVRWRHRSRGPRESLKFNQELMQTYYDIRTLRNKLDTVVSNYETLTSQIEEGGEIEDVQYNWEEEATPSSDSLLLEGIAALGAKVDMLRRRLRVLER